MSTALPCLPAPPSRSWVPRTWDNAAQGNLQAILSSACKRLPHNAQAHFHLGLLHMRNANGEDALRAFTAARTILDGRVRRCTEASVPVPPRLTKLLASLRAHTAQAAHLAASAKLSPEDRAPLLDRLQADLVASSSEDHAQPNVWNALALLHLGEGGFRGARDILRSICDVFPGYLDALNNLGLAELALGDERAAVSCFQNIVLRDVQHIEALSNYGLVLLRKGSYEAAAQIFRTAIQGVEAGAFGLAFVWGGLAVAEAAMDNMAEAERAAREAEESADSESKARFSMLRACIRARKVTSTLRQCVLPLDGRSSVFIKASPTTKSSRGSRRGDSGSSEHSIKKDADNTNLSTPSSGQACRGGLLAADHAGSAVGDSRAGDGVVGDHRAVIEETVSTMRTFARDTRSSFATSSLGAFLRQRHEYCWEESGNRNYGAESAERLVDALESDPSDSCSWVQLALLQLGAGEYESSRDFCIQSVADSRSQEAMWNALGVSFHLSNQVPEATRAFEKAAVAAFLNGDTRHNTTHLQSQDSLHQLPSDLSPPKSVVDVKSLKPNLVCGGDAAAKCQAANANYPSKEEEIPSPVAIGMGPGEETISFSMLSNVGAEGSACQKHLSKSCRAALAAIYNNIGNAKRHQGGAKSYAEAQTAFEKSLRLGGESPAVYNNLALLYISMNKLDDAEKMLSHVLSVAPRFDCSASNLIKLRQRIATVRSASQSLTDHADGDGQSSGP